MKIAQELIGQQFIEGEITVEDVRDQPFRHVLKYGRFKVENVRLPDRHSERVNDVREQRVKLVARQGSFPVSELQWHQRLRAWSSASRTFTPLDRTWPAGTERSSSRVDAVAARTATFLASALFAEAVLLATELVGSGRLIGHSFQARRASDNNARGNGRRSPNFMTSEINEPCWIDRSAIWGCAAGG